jgi:HEAT repeat protein
MFRGGGARGAFPAGSIRPARPAWAGCLVLIAAALVLIAAARLGAPPKGPDDLTRARNLLKDGSNRLAHDFVLRNFGILKARDLFESQMAKGDRDFRYRVAEELVTLRSVEVRRHLDRWLRSGDPRLRALAARCSSSMGADPDLDRRLLALLRDPDYPVRARALEALGQRRCAAALPEIKRILRQGPPSLQGVAVQALRSIGGPEAQGLLEWAADQGNPLVRYAAYNALKARAAAPAPGSR